MAITAIRSEYHLQRSIFQAIQDHPELELELVVTGAHLSPLHGYSIKEVESDGFPIVEKVESLLHSDHDAARLKGAALQLSTLAHIVDARRPDWLLTPADREESIALALCGVYMNIPTAHYSAGDRVVGNVDDTIRHAVSRLSHLLLTTNEDARQRLIKAGEEPFRVHFVGHAGLDRIRTAPSMAPEALAEALEIKAVTPPYIVIVQHPVSSQISEAGVQMRETLDAATGLGLQTFVSRPNSDAGGREMIRIIETYHDRPNIHIFKHIPDKLFVNLLRGAAVLIGNSSLGLLEAPFLRLPAINVGKRQTARHHAGNVFFVPHNRKAIVEQVRAILEDNVLQERIRHCVNPFGDGHTGPRVARLLAETPLDGGLLNKDLTF
jgi:GDP/UDP-N,N'-diacetylbacillosamine 2-epimerase (hydrolysing)